MEKEIKSLSLFKNFSKITPGGVHSNVRYMENQLYFSKAKGAYVWTVDNTKFLDFICGMGTVILGHAHPKVNKAVIDALEEGLLSGYETESSYKLSKMLTDIIPSAEMVRLSNTGTEAVMHAIMIARAFTKRKKILKFEGAYHGWYDAVSFNYHPPLYEEELRIIPDSEGLDNCMLTNSLVARYNDIQGTLEIINKNKEELAAVLVEPVMFNSGAVIPKLEFLKALRDETAKFDIPLIFDEIITGFRLAPGGAQERFGVIPDLSVFGKALANGFPISAVVGREDMISITKPGEKVWYAGTYNGNFVSVKAAIATLEVLKDGQIQKELDVKTTELEKFVSELADDYHIPVQLKGMGGQFQIYFTDKEIVDYRTAMTSDEIKYKKFVNSMFNSGLLFHPSKLFHHGITASHEKKELQILKENIEKSLQDIKTSLK
ncbi:MAG: aspartate aminotransferase family protein [Nitrososphaeria archaeon]